MAILVIDNYDSFTYNLVQYLGQCSVEILVRRNDEISLEQIEELQPDGVMLSPGPCTPTESGICLPITARYINEEGFQNRSGNTAPLFGVCLGHQAIGFVAGGVVKQARNIMHGKASLVRHDGQGIFEGMPNPFSAIRYHSLVVTPDSVPPGFKVAASSTDDGEVMGLRHEHLPIESVQFHPESVLTEGGFKIIQNFARRVGEAASR